MNDRYLSQSEAVAPLVANGLLVHDSGSVRGQYFTVLGQVNCFQMRFKREEMKVGSECHLQFIGGEYAGFRRVLVVIGGLQEWMD